MALPLTADLARELARLQRGYLALDNKTAAAMLERDELVYRLMNQGVSATAIAEVLGVDRTWPYGIRDTYPSRKQRWDEERAKR